MPVLTKINTNVIADDAITGAKFAGDTYLENTATQNLSGTYAESRMYTSDAYTLTGDTTVNANLVLSSVKGDDSDITLTADSTTRTLTGTGVLSGGSIVAKVNADLTGMTGELGSVVTGSPAITGLGTVTTGTLGSGVTFPTGHVVNSGFVKLEGGNHEMNSSTAETVFNYVDITCAVGNTIYFGVAGTNVSYRNAQSYYVHAQKQLRYHTSDVAEGAAGTGTVVQTTHDGQILLISASGANNTYNSFNMTGAFVAAQTTYYLGLSFYTANSSTTSLIYMNSDYPVWVYHYELKGDVQT